MEHGDISRCNRQPTANRENSANKRPIVIEAIARGGSAGGTCNQSAHRAIARVVSENFRCASGDAHRQRRAAASHGIIRLNSAQPSP